MLETKNLTKIYKPKKGVPVTAIDRISLTFPDTGMVFLLGKSGSGKSTLLNLLGGLDQYDNGEIMIKGVSSKHFSQTYFDSYRNTYVGFIFQEYNVLEEFSVGANIALALELQGRKATDEEINRILTEVDLAGYGNRKPNELSGGQKQRVAIARALVKSPEIIMADEPTGALDSATGKQVFDTLKKLSKSKLIIIVSHDRDFAMQYADRIIELADGHVISDLELSEGEETQAEEPAGIEFRGTTAHIPQGYHLTEEDRIAINAYIDRLSSGADLNLSANAAKQKSYVPTDISKIRKRDGSDFKLIKSKLPLKNAFKIGSNGLKYKKFRLVITILLSCIAFTLFGLADTFGAYDHIKTCTNSIADTGVTYAAINKEYQVGSGLNTYWHSWGHRLTQEEIQKISAESGIEFHAVYAPGESLEFDQQLDPEAVLTESDYKVYSTGFNGFVELEQKDLDTMGYTLIAGRLPEGGKQEIAISKYTCETFRKAGYLPMPTEENQKPAVVKINDYGDMVGKTLTLGKTQYTVTGVVDTLVDLDRYLPLTKKQENLSKADELINMVLFSEYVNAMDAHPAKMILVGPGDLDRLTTSIPHTATLSLYNLWLNNSDYSLYIGPDNIARLSDMDSSLIQWVDGAKTTLGEKEIIITSDMVQYEDTGNGYQGGVYTYIDQEMVTQPVDLQKLAKENLSLRSWYINSSEDIEETDGYKIVGVIDVENEKANLYSTIITADSLYATYSKGGEGMYTTAVGAMPREKSQIRDLVSYCYEYSPEQRYAMCNAATYELDSVDETLHVLSKVFLYIGLGFALFAAIMLANFIATSISYKKQEIGILRAIGSRSNDVFRIFFAESFIIAMINFVFSCLGVFAATALINYMIRTHTGILITVLSFGVRQIALLFVVSLAVAALASFFPVKKIASKRPIDAIRNR